MMWKDEGYMAGGKKLLNPSLKVFSNVFNPLRCRMLKFDILND